MCLALDSFFSHPSTVQCLQFACYVISVTRSVSRCTYECRNRSCSYLLRVRKMPFVFSHVEYCDMHFVYGFCNGNALAAVGEYRRRFPDRRIPSSRVFTRIHQTLRDTGCLPSVKVRSEREVEGTINTRENILETIQTALLLPFSPCWYVLKTAWQLEEDTLNSSCKARPRVLPSTLNRETAATPNTS